MPIFSSVVMGISLTEKKLSKDFSLKDIFPFLNLIELFLSIISIIGIYEYFH